MAITINTQYEIKCSRCNREIKYKGEGKPTPSSLRPIFISDGGDGRDCVATLMVEVSSQYSYGYSYDESVLCKICQKEALKKAIKKLDEEKEGK